MITLRSTISSLLLGFTLNASASPEIGDAAPDFQLKGSDGNTYSVSQFKGKQPVVIAFFPKASTSG